MSTRQQPGCLAAVADLAPWILPCGPGQRTSGSHRNSGAPSCWSCGRGGGASGSEVEQTGERLGGSLTT
jgi:hypothetical protein